MPRISASTRKARRALLGAGLALAANAAFGQPARAKGPRVWQKSRQYGVTGVPTFVIGERGVVGAQPYEALEQLVK